MKNYVIILTLLLFTLASCAAPPEDVSTAQVVTEPVEPVAAPETNTERGTSINLDNSSFQFEGFAVGKAHNGTFTDWEGWMELNGTNNTDVKAFGATIQAESVDTGIGGLDRHLMNDDFFDVGLYPTIRFTSNRITPILDSNQSLVNGQLTFHGVQNQIEFPVNITNGTVYTNFLLDTTPFNIKYTGVNELVRIEFNITT